MQNHKHISQAISRSIDAASSILLIAHAKPDGDTLGCNLAMAKFLMNQEKAVTVFCRDEVPTYLKFLPNSNLVTTDTIVFTQPYDLVITLDCASLEYADVDTLVTTIPSEYTSINIDHHNSNPNFGHINLVISDASSGAEVLYRLFKDWDIDWDKDIATCLATGMITDTGGFKNPATNYQVLSGVSEMTLHGANTYQIMQQALIRTDVNKLKLLGRALERLKKVEKYDMVYTYIREQDYIDCNIDSKEIDSLANMLHVLKDACFVMVLRENGEGIIKGSLRTTRDIDLSKLAQMLGGGGHKKASGFSLPGTMVYDNNKLKIV